MGGVSRVVLAPRLGETGSVEAEEADLRADGVAIMALRRTTPRRGAPLLACREESAPHASFLRSMTYA